MANFGESTLGSTGKQRMADEPTQASERIDKKRFGGIPANAFYVPVAIVLVLLHACVIGLIISINTESGRLSQTMQVSSVCVTDATSLLGGSSLLSETAGNYVLMPITTTGEQNISPLVAYAAELAQDDHRGDAVRARFETYPVSEQVQQDISEAARCADELIGVQLRAIALVSAAYPLPATPELDELKQALPALSAEDAALPNDEKVKRAQTLMLDPAYASNKGAVSRNVNEAVGMIRAASGAEADAAQKNIATLRIVLWVTTFAIIVVLFLVFVALYRMFISPISRFSKLIVDGRPLNSGEGLREMRLLAGSYNSLRERRDSLEGMLREAAETDELTGLPNRYSFKNHLVRTKGQGYSLAVFVFDIDRLKYTNDTFGHAAGDDLIRRAARCISTCFTSIENGECYRIGGDEFIGILRSIDEGRVSNVIARFKDMIADSNVSISWGHAFAADVANTSFMTLLDEADRKMYQMKEEAHRRDGRS